MNRPDRSEYNEYYHTYISKVPDGDVCETLERGLQTTKELLGDVGRSLEAYRYAPDKWTLNEVVGHVVDAERIFGYRAMCFAREDPAELPGMDQDAYVRASGANDRGLTSLLDELELLRRSHLALFRSFDETVALRRGIASGFEFTVRALVYIVAGHEIHHRRVIEERYLTPDGHGRT